jgi:hypothetical protein
MGYDLKPLRETTKPLYGFVGKRIELVGHNIPCFIWHTAKNLVQNTSPSMLSTRSTLIMPSLEEISSIPSRQHCIQDASASRSQLLLASYLFSKAKKKLETLSKVSRLVIKMYTFTRRTHATPTINLLP